MELKLVLGEREAEEVKGGRMDVKDRRIGGSQ